MDEWPADSVERRPVASLVPYVRNARTHTAEQISQIAGSIREFGFTVPILVDESGGLIAGHARLQAAQKLGLVDVPVMVAQGWSAAKKRAYVIADNKLALNASWDMELLRAEFGDLLTANYDLAFTGFNADEIAALRFGPQEGLTDPDEAPDVPIEPISALGDVWILGRHRLVCGDCTMADAVEKAMNGVKPHLMVTDPPYGVEYDAAWRGSARKPSGDRLSIGVHAKGKVENDSRADWREAWTLFQGDVAYVWHAGLLAAAAGESLEAVGFSLRSQIIWNKNNFAISQGHYHWKHEPCWYAVRGKGHWTGDHKQSTVWEIPKPQKSETGHSTQKPVECMKRPIENNSSPGQAVYDPFVGSGTTIIAAEMTGRCCHAIELNPSYVDVAIARWQNFTGLNAILEATGKPFKSMTPSNPMPGPPD